MRVMNQQPFHAVSMDMEEMEKKIKEHRRKIFLRTSIAVAVVLLVFFIVYVICEMQTFRSHEVMDSWGRNDTAATSFMMFRGNVLKYSNDGAFYTDASNHLIWNQTYEMEDPFVVTSGNYVAIGNRKGSRLYLMDTEGLCAKIDTTQPIMRIKLSDKGTVAILMENQGTTYLKLYDKSGKNLAEGELHAKNHGYPLDIALSKDGKELAVSMLDIHGETVKSVVYFYNYGSAGQKKMDNLVASFEYEDSIITQLEYLSDDKLLAVGDQSMILFAGTNKPQETKAIKYETRLRTFFYDNRYLGMIFDNEGAANDEEKDVYCLKVYDGRGNLVREKTFSRTYRKAEFLSNHEICLYNENECTIYTLRGVEKYHESLDRKLYQVIPGGFYGIYTFIFEGETDQVRLK